MSNFFDFLFGEGFSGLSGSNRLGCPYLKGRFDCVYCGDRHPQGTSVCPNIQRTHKPEVEFDVKNDILKNNSRNVIDGEYEVIKEEEI